MIHRFFRRVFLRLYRWYEIRDYQRSAKRREALRKRYELLLRKGPDPPTAQKNSFSDPVEVCRRNGIYNDVDE